MRLHFETAALKARWTLRADSFGKEFTIVEAISDSESTTEIWLAFAKPNQAVTLVLAAVPEGWTANNEVNLGPGDVYKLSSE